MALIPSFKPTQELLNITNSLISKNIPVVVVNDGSPASCDEIFNKLSDEVFLLKNAINLGKGAALKHGINFILNNFSNLDFIITLDSDGQHKIEDVLKLKDSLKNDVDLAIGAREFDSNVPFRSRFGNKLTRIVFKAMFGIKLNDTQTGLRAFNPAFARLILSSVYNGYEFEMQMLIEACNRNINILQIPISTIYIDNNAQSHFNPVFDSLSIYFVLFRHIGNSLLTALIDYIVFVVAFSLGFGLLTCMISGRVVAGSFNFIVGKTLVFKTKANWAFEITSYIALTIVLMFVSMYLIRFIASYSGFSEILIKPVCELMIFAVSFLVQRLFIFAPKFESLDSNGAKATN